MDAYRKAMNSEELESVTDDASVVERFTTHPVYLSEGDYDNLKVTTPTDIILAEALLKNRC